MAQTKQNPTPEIPRENSDNPVVLARMFMEAAHKLWLQIQRAASYLMVELRGYEAFDKVAKWCVRHPYQAICIVAGTLVVVLPFLVIFGFCMITVALTFTGFLVLEGTLLTIVSMMLFGCLAALAIVIVVLAIVSVAVYCGFAHIYDINGGFGDARNAFQKFMQNERHLRKESPVRKISSSADDKNK